MKHQKITGLVVLALAINLLAFGVGILAESLNLPHMRDVSPRTVAARNVPPQLSDFTPPYTCPNILAPASCSTPIKIAVECVDLRTIDPRQLTRPLTKTELANAEKACELLPLWLDQDPRIKVTKYSESDLTLTYRINPSGFYFTSTSVFLRDTNFGISKPFQDPFDEAAYFVEQSVLELGKRGYLP